MPGYDFAQHGCCSWVGAPLGPIDPDVVAAAGDAISTAHSTASAGYGALMAKHVRNAFDGRLGEWGTPEAALGWEPMPNYNMGLGDADHVSVEFGAKSGAAGASVAGMHGRGSINYFKWAQRIDDEPRTLLRPGVQGRGRDPLLRGRRDDAHGAGRDALARAGGRQRAPVAP